MIADMTVEPVVHLLPEIGSVVDHVVGAPLIDPETAEPFQALECTDQARCIGRLGKRGAAAVQDQDRCARCRPFRPGDREVLARATFGVRRITGRDAGIYVTVEPGSALGMDGEGEGEGEGAGGGAATPGPANAAGRIAGRRTIVLDTPRMSVTLDRRRASAGVRRWP